MILEPGKAKPLEKWVTDYLYDEIYIKRFKPMMTTHRSSSHEELKARHSANWKEYLDPEIEQYLVDNVYPYSEPLKDIWVKKVSAEHINEDGYGGFIGMHADHEGFSFGADMLQFINSFLLHKSDDLEGGYIVLAGDSYETKLQENRPHNSRDFMSRLVVIPYNNVGEGAWWNSRTIHGVSQVTKGERISFMVTKHMPYDDKYFLRSEWK